MSDAEFVTREAAARALLVDAPGGRTARSVVETRHLLQAAADGVAQFHRQGVVRTMLQFLIDLERATAKVPRPIFESQPIPFDNLHLVAVGSVEGESPSHGASVRMDSFGHSTDDAIRMTNAVYENVTAVMGASRHILQKYSDEAIASMLSKSDGLRIVMAAYTIGAARIHEFREPQPIELALIAVAIGLEGPLGARGSRDQPDSSDFRRNDWRYPRNQAREYIRLHGKLVAKGA